ncbi:MAG: ankyrin repeat domain-containing protein [Alphaproteobacteria bacterium]|nr:MAG: ankyrin repeat domain-containing protein [Alphaproteobacteria bacterium]
MFKSITKVFKRKAEVDVFATDHFGRTALHMAAWKGHTDTACALIERGAHINGKDASGWTPLHFAAWKGHTDTLSMLIRKGANINAKNRAGEMPLELVTRNGSAEQVIREAISFRQGRRVKATRVRRGFRKGRARSSQSSLSD